MAGNGWRRGHDISQGRAYGVLIKNLETLLTFMRRQVPGNQAGCVGWASVMAAHSNLVFRYDQRMISPVGPYRTKSARESPGMVKKLDCGSPWIKPEWDDES